MIYADNAATTKISQTALNAMLPYLAEHYGNPSSPYSLGRKAKDALENARARIAACIGCRAGEILFTSGGSESDNQAILTAAQAGEKAGKRHIISTSFEHPAVLRTLEYLRKKGFSITLLDVPPDGILTVQQFSEAIRKDTCLVSMMYANNEIGTIQPVSEVGMLCRERGILFHTDAVQAGGHLHISTQEQKIDMLSLSAHKFHGPKGTGILFVRHGISPVGMILGGPQERGKRAGTENVPAVVGMAAALEESCSRIESDTARLLPLRDRLISGLSLIPGSMLNGSRLGRLAGNVSFCFEGIEGESLLLLLDQNGICASSGSACSSGALDPSHVLLSIGRSRVQALGSLRLTIGEDCCETDTDCIIDTVTESVSRLRRLSPL